MLQIGKKILHESGQGRAQLGLWGICMGFCLATGIAMAHKGQWALMLACLGTVFLVSLPVFVARLLKIRLSRSFFTFFLLYALGPMLGKIYKLYYLTAWWDKLVHTMAGVVFAALGAYLLEQLNRGNQTSLPARAVFALCLSIAVAALWEFFEFSVDRFFGADMQHDTVITAIHSHYLSPTPGEIHSITGIRDAAVNGESLNVGGYLDIGLFDTMADMMVETLGAIAYSAWYLFDQDRHPQIFPANA